MSRIGVYFKSLAVLAIIAQTVSCSLVSDRPQNQPVVRDVPYQAREKSDASPRKRVMVLPFIAQGRSNAAAVAAREAFLRSLRATDEFVIIANSDFPKDLSTYFKNDEYDLESMAKVGGGLGLAAIIEGRIIDLKAKRIGDVVGLVREVRAKLSATVQIRVVNTMNAHIAMNETRSAEIEDSTTRVGERAGPGDSSLEDDPHLIQAVVTQAFKSTVPRIVQNVDKLTWEGRVAMVKGDRIYLNAGRLSGIQLGDILKVTEEGEDVYDPETGSLIGKVPGRLKGTIEVVSYFGRDGSVGIVHSGSGFRENDHVELY